MMCRNLLAPAPTSQLFLLSPSSAFSDVIWVPEISREISKCCKAELFPLENQLKVRHFTSPLPKSISLFLYWEHTHEHAHIHTHAHSALSSCKHWHLSLEHLTYEIIGSILTKDFSILHRCHQGECEIYPAVFLNSHSICSYPTKTQMSLTTPLLSRRCSNNSKIGPPFSPEPSCTNSPLAWWGSTI